MHLTILPEARKGLFIGPGSIPRPAGLAEDQQVLLSTRDGAAVSDFLSLLQQSRHYPGLALLLTSRTLFEVTGNLSRPKGWAAEATSSPLSVIFVES